MLSGIGVRNGELSVGSQDLMPHADYQPYYACVIEHIALYSFEKLEDGSLDLSMGMGNARKANDTTRDVHIERDAQNPVPQVYPSLFASSRWAHFNNARHLYLGS